MVYGDDPTNNSGCNYKQPCVLIFSKNTNNKGNKKRKHGDTLVPTEDAWFEKHNVAKEHTAKKGYYSLDKGEIESVSDDELLYVLHCLSITIQIIKLNLID